MSGLTSAVTGSQRGIALVITLILISVTLFMALAFLAISNREHGTVATATDAANARLAADAALAAAEAQIVANTLTAVLNTNSPNVYGLLVSTNFINGNGFQNTAGPFYGSPLNVNYYYPNGTPVAGNDAIQNVANLQILPRVPVYMSNTVTHVMENRFYLDLNRNGYDDPNGMVTNLNLLSNGTVQGNGDNSFEIGDPEWVGILARPDATHGPQNLAQSRYAFIAVPVGNTLDINAIYDQTATATVNPSTASHVADGFFRNEGVGSWELNLAAFLTDLNTNIWDPVANPYNYLEWMQSGNANNGAGFVDALDLLSYRYGFNYNSLAFGSAALYTNNIDGYTIGNLMTNTTLPLAIYPKNHFPVNYSWAGSDNTNRYFTLDELFNSAETYNFAGDLAGAGTNSDTYDRYTFYRMLDQLGSDSTPESGLMNLNYDNLDPAINGVYNLNGTRSVTNFLPWTAQSFFTNAADRMLKAYTAFWATSYVATANYTLYPSGYAPYLNPYYTNAFGATTTGPFGVTSIPVMVGGQFVYQPSVQRLLQLAANIYDASTNAYYPSVFRPIFEHDNLGNLYIIGYTNLSSTFGPNTVTGSTDPQLATPYDVSQVTNLGASFTPITDAKGLVNVYGVPWIIGAKKGFPTFNKFSMETFINISRKLEVVSSTPGGKTYNPNATFTATNVMWVFGISNAVGVDCWNSYNTNYSPVNNLTILVVDNLAMSLATTNGNRLVFSNFMVPPVTLPIPTTISWPASDWLPSTGSSDALDPFQPSPFFSPLSNSIPFLPNSYYQFSPQQFVPQNDPNSLVGFQNVPITTPLPQMVLATTNHFSWYMLDGAHVIDYVQFSGPTSATNLNSQFQTTNTTAGYGNWWSTVLPPLDVQRRASGNRQSDS